MVDIDAIQRAIDLIEAEMDKPLTLSQIAAAAHLSQAQLYRLFYAMTGHPVKDYIRKRRISSAAAQLRSSQRSVTEIGWECGFESYHVFAKVFKKLVGLSPTEYREAEQYYSFERISLRVKAAHLEACDKADTAVPNVRVIRLWPSIMYGYLHISAQEEGIELAAFRVVHERIRALRQDGSKFRVYGYNVDLFCEEGIPRFGYQVLVTGDDRLSEDPFFQEEAFAGGLYAVRRTAAFPAERVIAAWDELLSEWLPKSKFDRSNGPCVEEFIAYNDNITRMYLYLPVVRKTKPDSIEIVERQMLNAIYCRRTGQAAQPNAERRLIDWYEQSGGNQQKWHGRYYMSFSYHQDDEPYWWENGIISEHPQEDPFGGLNSKQFESGRYACVKTKTYGAMTGVLDNVSSWISRNDRYQFDKTRQWFAEYETRAGTDLVLDTIVRVYVPVAEVRDTRTVIISG